jgi:hypothetical protein
VIKGIFPFFCVRLVYNNLAFITKIFWKNQQFFLNQVIFFIPTKNICVELSTFLFFFL